MNLLLLLPEDRVQGDRFRITGPRLAHLRQVLKIEPGGSLKAGLLDGPVGRAELRSIDASQAELQLFCDGPPPPRPRLHVILCVPRPKLLRRLLPELVALGIGELTLLRSWRVAQPYLSSPVLEPEGYTPLVHLGLMQAGCTRPPKIRVARAFRPYAEDVAPGLPGDKLCLHPGALQRMEAIRLPGDGPLNLAIGPEGGFVGFELEAWQAAGFQLVRMGERILRVETACVAAVAQTALLRRQAALAAEQGPA